MKGNWTEWDREGQVSKEMEKRRKVMDTNFRVKGSDSVDWSKMRVTI